MTALRYQAVAATHIGQHEDNEDSYLVDRQHNLVVVADGVGGWRQYGVDPGQFSTHLMKNCERLVKAGYYRANQPAKLLAQAFR